jgi:hypothetical protein
MTFIPLNSGDCGPQNASPNEIYFVRSSVKVGNIHKVGPRSYFNRIQKLDNRNIRNKKEGLDNPHQLHFPYRPGWLMSQTPEYIDHLTQMSKNKVQYLAIWLTKSFRIVPLATCNCCSLHHISRPA